MSRVGLSSFRAATASRKTEHGEDMQPHGHNPMKCGDPRLERIAAIHRAHARELERRVAMRAHATTETIEDACSHAWLQLITRPHVDVARPREQVLGWLALTATREAWRLERRSRRDELVDPAALEHCLRARTVPGADELAAQRDRLRLVADVAERPRRFLLALAAGHSYREIAAGEAVSVTTTAEQIARARRRLRALDTEQAASRQDGSTRYGVPSPPTSATFASAATGRQRTKSSVTTARRTMSAKFTAMTAP